MTFDRREWLKAGGALALAATLPACSAGARKGAPSARVVVIGAGWGGASAATYLRRWAPDVEVTVVERGDAFISCPQSNLVLSGGRTLESLTVPYGKWATKHGIRFVKGEAEDIDATRRLVTLAGGQTLPYDRLILSPGVDLDYGGIPGLKNPDSRTDILHAWKAGPQTVALRRQLEALADGGVYVLTIPKAPYRCPPGPYERTSLVAAYFKRHKPRSKVIVLDGNPDIVSKKGLFLTAWKELYAGIIDYRANNALVDVDVRGRRVITEFETVSAGVINVVPPQHAGRIARIAGVVNSEDRWVRVNHLSYESTAVPGIHVIGDATVSTPAPKSGHVANQQGKVAAAAVADLLAGRTLHTDPSISNTCYSFVSNEEAINVAAVYRVDAGGSALKLAEGSSGVSDARSALEAEFARAWAANIWADMLG